MVTKLSAGTATNQVAAWDNTNLDWVAGLIGVATGSVLFALASGAVGSDSGLFWDNANKRVGVGTVSPTGSIECAMNNDVFIYASAYGAGNTGTFIGKQAGGTLGSPTQTILNDIPAQFGLIGYGATHFSGIQAAINMAAAENWTDSAQGTYITLETTPKLSTTRGVAMRIDSTGYVGIGTVSPAVPLDVNGVINTATGFRIAGAATSGNLLTGNGTNFVSTAPVTATNGLVTSAGNNIIVATAGYADLPTYPISMTLPGAGTYLIFYSVCGYMVTVSGGYLFVEFYNVTDGADITDTQRTFLPPTVTTSTGLLSAISIITVGASKNIRLYAYRAGTGGTVFVLGGALQQATAGYVRLA